ncbi:multidrug effflux MFS transporter [Rhizobacter sp. LjRoot28]|uniref:multidrug effflux MFS transporter n=1 Tax=Rhizobacter sp. LjRoot28 TaxID=3342309 RepID=UPI003ED133C0
MNASRLLPVLVLGLLSAIGPLAVDMYLPALPSIAQLLGADDGAVQMSLTAFLAAVAVSQLAYGPASDRFGRRLPLAAGLLLFVAGSVGCAMAREADVLVASRFLQGLGAGAAMTIPRAVVRDLHTGAEAARLMSLLMLVFGISPLLGPLAGSLVAEAAGWRAIFWFQVGTGVAGLLLLALLLPETRSGRSAQADAGWRGARAAYGRLLRDRHFLGVSLVGAFGMAAFFVYLANSAFVLIGHYGLTPRQYSLVYSVNALSFFGVAQLTGPLSRLVGLARTVRLAATGFTVMLGALLVLATAGVDHLGVMGAFLFVAFGFLGLVIPGTAVLALEAHGPIAGTASALMATVQLAIGALVMGVTGLLLDGTAFPMISGITFCAMVSLAFARLSLGPRRLSLASATGG